VAEKFAAEGQIVYLVDRRASPAGYQLNERLITTPVTDLAEPDQIMYLADLENVDAVCHLAACADVYEAAREPMSTIMNSVIATLNVARLCAEQEWRLIYASTWEVYGCTVKELVDETSPCNADHYYSAGKLAGEHYARAAENLSGRRDWLTILRLGTAYGPHMRRNAVIPAMIDRAAAGRPIFVTGDGSQFRQFTHCEDIANAFWMAYCHPDLAGTYNIVDRTRTTIKWLAEQIAGEFGVEVQYKPPRPGDATPVFVSPSRAERVLGWLPRVPFHKGLKEMIAEKRSR